MDEYTKAELDRIKKMQQTIYENDKSIEKAYKILINLLILLCGLIGLMLLCIIYSAFRL